MTRSCDDVNVPMDYRVVIWPFKVAPGSSVRVILYPIGKVGRDTEPRFNE
jgi:hypothetical protein